MTPIELARNMGHVVKDHRGRETFEFDSYGLDLFVATLRAGGKAYTEEQKDAARYRWIRDTQKGVPAGSEFWPGIKLNCMSWHDEWRWYDPSRSLDAAIDEEIKLREEQ